MSAGHGADALAIGLVCGVIFETAGPSDSLRDAAVRLEPVFGGSRVDPDAGSLLADAAGRVIARLDGPSAQRHQARALVWLETVRATEHAGLSRALTAGLEARLVAAAEAIVQAAESGGSQGLANAGRLVRLALDHERAGDHRARLDRLQMAARLCRWLCGRRRANPGVWQCGAGLCRGRRLCGLGTRVAQSWRWCSGCRRGLCAASRTRRNSP